jgi:hypothetical protein
MHIIHVSIGLCAQGKATLQLAALPCKDDDCFDVSVNDPKKVKARRPTFRTRKKRKIDIDLEGRQDVTRRAEAKSK